MRDQPLTPEQWARARALFDQWVDLPSEQREAVLAEHAADPAADPDVLREVRSLLAHAALDDGAPAGGFLATPAQPAWLAAEAATDTPDRQGQQLGAWRITGLLGRGGMGEVWAARRADGAYEGSAAIKVLKRGMDSQRVLARFAQEQRALGRLNHPHIAHLLDAGRTDDGLPYFVMEAVDGVPIDQACSGLSLEQQLALFLQLADAVAHAHRQLLVHRDLKPSNVLVDRQGQVKLLDFGIAKALDPLEDGGSSQPTVAGERPFTPQYASPEQVKGEPVGTGTDVYSLGVLLYIMLTGVRPYGRDASSAREAARSVLEEEPTRPSALSPGLVADKHWLATRRRLAGDLDNILLKALDKRPEQRYASVDALAADIRAHLAGYPVSARAASWGYPMRKFIARNRVAVGLAGLGLLALIGGMAATLWQKQQADAARGVAEAQRALAQQRFVQVRQMANSLVFKYHDQIEYLPGAAAVREAILTDAVAFMDRLRQAGVDDAGLAEELAATYYRISRLQGGGRSAHLGQFGPAEANLDKAIALGPAYLDRPEVSIQALSQAVSMHVARAEALQRRGRPADAERALRQGLPVLARALGRDANDSWALASAVTLHGVHAAILSGRPQQAHLGRWQEGCAAADRARAAAEATQAADPANVYLPDTLAFTLAAQARCRLQADDLEAAVALRLREIELRDQMAARMPDDIAFRWQRALARGGLAQLRSAQGRHAEALALLATARAMGREAVAADPRNAGGRDDQLGLDALLPAVQLAAGQTAAARASADTLLAALVLDDGAGSGPRQRRAEALVIAAQVWLRGAPAGPPRALALADEAAALLQPAHADDDHPARRWLRAQAWTVGAAALAATGQRDAARARAGQALQAWGLTDGAGPPLPPALQRIAEQARQQARPGP